MQERLVVGYCVKARVNLVDDKKWSSEKNLKSGPATRWLVGLALPFPLKTLEFGTTTNLHLWPNIIYRRRRHPYILDISPHRIRITPQHHIQLSELSEARTFVFWSTPRLFFHNFLSILRGTFHRIPSNITHCWWGFAPVMTRLQQLTHIWTQQLVYQHSEMES